jgi:ABC-type transporter Mla MlaB component
MSRLQLAHEMMSGSSRCAGLLPSTTFSNFRISPRKPPLPRVLLIDLEGVPYVDSAALGSFVGIHVSCDQAGRKYALIGVNERVKALFAMTGVAQFLVTRNNLAEAEGDFSEPS